jgi:hypothetical protein
MADSPHILEHSTQTLPSRMAAPIFFGIFQFVWLVLFTIDKLFNWDGPKNLAWDSFCYLLGATPSIIAFIIAAYICRYHLIQTHRKGLIFICVGIMAVSALLVVLGIGDWAVNVLLDPHGRWIEF